jgi:hypothetical protein
MQPATNLPTPANALRATIDGAEYRIGFRHTQEFLVKEGKKIPVLFDYPNVKQPVRAVTECYVVKRLPTQTVDELRGQPPVATGQAVCAWADASAFTKEFARQVSLARALAQLPRPIAGPLLGAYLRSGERPVLNLGGVRVTRGTQRVPVAKLRDVLALAASSPA